MNTKFSKLCTYVLLAKLVSRELTEKIEEEHKNLQVSAAAHVYNVLKVEKQGLIKKAKGFVHGKH